jgi:hypothetical protein
MLCCCNVTACVWTMASAQLRCRSDTGAERQHRPVHSVRAHQRRHPQAGRGQAQEAGKPARSAQHGATLLHLHLYCDKCSAAAVLVGMSVLVWCVACDVVATGAFCAASRLAHCDGHEKRSGTFVWTDRVSQCACLLIAQAAHSVLCSKQIPSQCSQFHRLCRSCSRTLCRASTRQLTSTMASSCSHWEVRSHCWPLSASHHVVGTCDDVLWALRL